MDSFDLHQIESELRELKGQGGRRSIELRDRETARRLAARQWERRKAQVRQATQGTVQAKEDACTLDPNAYSLWEQYDGAVIAENYAKACAKDLERDQSGVQTRAKLALKAMDLAGFGGGA